MAKSVLLSKKEKCVHLNKGKKSKRVNDTELFQFMKPMKHAMVVETF